MNQESVAVAVNAQRAEVEFVARGFALLPQRLAASRPEVDAAALDGPGEGLVVHPAEHEDAAAHRILDDGGNQTVLVPVDFRGHETVARSATLKISASGGRTGIPRSARKRFTSATV